MDLLGIISVLPRSNSLQHGIPSVSVLSQIRDSLVYENAQSDGFRPLDAAAEVL